ncbi:hypothetical protein [Streptomyces sp. F001]|uniref:hypothetical protein n=1 Tax=Streptomyces sp. F001 TaxID=1510026 RepID=UPI0013EED863|nr:hypothetical protein [Streptomyces sp. F001]
MLSAGPLTDSLAYAMFFATVVVMLAALAAWTIRAVLKKSRAEDVPEVLLGLSHVVGALSCFLPWGKWRNVPGQVPVSPAAEGQPGAAAAQAPSISITAGQMAVMPPPVPGPGTAEGQLPAAGGGRGEQ